MDLEDRRIEDILPLAPSFLHKKFRWIGVNTIADVLAIDPDEFAQEQGIGERAVLLLVGFQKELKHSPDRFIEYIERQAAIKQEKIDRRLARKPPYAAPIVVPERIDPERPFFVNFVAFEEELSRLSEKWGKKQARNHMIIRCTFGIHCRKMIMELLGTYHNLTRERVRQIKARSLVNMRKMLSGNTVGQPRRKCPTELVRQLLSFQQEHVSNRSVILRSGIIESDPRVKDVSEPHVNLLMAVLGYETATYREHAFFYDTEQFNQQTLRASITAILHSIRDELFPVSASAVAKRLKAKIPDMGLTSEIVQNILEEVPDFEYATVDKRSGFQLCIHMLSNSGAMALRILRDAGTPMHFRDFVRAVNQCRIRAGEEKIVAFPGVITHLVKSEHASPVRRTGFWALKEWGVKTNSIREIMVAALQAGGAPMTSSELCDIVQRERPDVKRKSAAKLQVVYKETFVRLESGKVALREWNIDGE